MPFDPNIRLDQFYKEIETLEKEFISFVKKLSGKTPSKVELTTFLTQFDFFNVLSEQGYTGKVQQFVSDWDSQILRLLNLADVRGAEMVARVNIADLQTLKDLELGRLLRRGQDYAGEVRGELLKQLLTGADMETIRNRVLPAIQSEMKFYPSWFNAMLNTSYSEYMSTGLQKLTEDIPGVRYVLQGPNDPHTRKQCKHALQIMKNNPEGFTLQEIKDGALGTYKTKDGIVIYGFKNRGGYNCRHWLEVVSESITGGLVTLG